MLAPDLEALPLEHVAQHPGTGKREVQVQLVKASHQYQVALAHRLRQVVDVRAKDLHQLGLPAYRQFMCAIDHFFALAPSIRPSAPAKKSFSSASWPILACMSLT